MAHFCFLHAKGEGKSCFKFSVSTNFGRIFCCSAQKRWQTESVAPTELTGIAEGKRTNAGHSQLKALTTLIRISEPAVTRNLHLFPSFLASSLCGPLTNGIVLPFPRAERFLLYQHKPKGNKKNPSDIFIHRLMMMDTYQHRTLFSFSWAAALTRAFKRDDLVSSQSDIMALSSDNTIVWFEMDRELLKRLIKIIIMLLTTTANGLLR